MEPENLEVIMQLIMHGEDAKGNAMESIQAAKKGNFEVAEEKIKAANEALLQAHHAQTNLLTEEASGNPVSLSLLMVHGQDHLMTAIAFKDVAREIVDLYKKLDS